MKLSILLVLMSLHCSVALLYYITPESDAVENQTCTVNGTVTIRPCYSLQQLNSLSNKSLVMLLLLPGTHVIPRSHTLTASNISELEIRPWNEQQEVVVQCRLQAGFIFKDNGKLKIFSLKFTSCTLHCMQRIHMVGIINITDCTFADSKQNYAILVDKIIELELLINNCNFSSNNGAIYTGGAIKNNVSVTITDTTFLSNKVDDAGGALCIEYYVDLILIRSKLIDNTAPSGGAIYSFVSSVTIYDTIFQSNYANEAGGAIYSKSSSVLIGNTTFRSNNVDDSGGAIYSETSNLTIYDSWFTNNSAMVSGAAINSQITRTLNVNNTILQDNFANISGGAIYTEFANISNCQLKNNSARNLGGALYFYKHLSDIDLYYGDEITVISNTNCSLNEAGYSGGAIYCEKTRMIRGIVIYKGVSKSNSALNGGFAYLSGCHVTIAELDIIGNSAANGGAIYAEKSTILLLSLLFNRIFTKVVISNNTAENKGGALFLANSQIRISIEWLVFEHNKVTSAVGKGGAIFVLDSDCEIILTPRYHQCFVDNYNLYSEPLYFFNNSATHGSVLYGGLLDRCVPDNRHRSPPINNGIKYFKDISNSYFYELYPLAITSEPVTLCLCSNFKPVCTTRELITYKMRGQTLYLTGTLVDQDKNQVASTITAYYKEPSAELDKGEGRKALQSNCSTLSYHIFTNDSSATLVLGPDGYCERSPLSSINIHIMIVPCSRGFEQNNDRCSCDRRLTNFNITVCNIDTQTIKRRGSIWLRYDEQYLKVHTNCPLDYCQVTSDTITLSSPDEQCANSRSGVICGACQRNHSIALGGNKCLRCTSSYTFIWLTLVLTVAGVALVALLLVCNMTISAGTLNGLIFYANVVSISGMTTLSNCSINPILSIFIAWINLDLGVETCFYSGMNTYEKTWLQFAFPLYIWLLVAAIIVASYYSTTAMKVFGRNNIAILATLFLLSYSKILKTIITALSVTQVLVGKADNVSDQLVPYKVWSYDGNIEYRKGKHVVLFTVALLLLLFLFLPYTLLLIFGQCARSMSVRRRWILWWIRSTAFISIMDAYHAPYNKRHRYWTGLMLLTRCVLFLAFASSYRDNDILANTYITTLVTVGILTLKTLATKVYKMFYLNILELCFLLNLVVFSATLYYLKGSNSSDSTICKSVTASISISFIIFIGILAYHAYIQTQKTKYYKPIKLFLLKKWPIKRHRTHPVERVPTDTNCNMKILPTSTLVELREELLASDGSERHEIN